MELDYSHELGSLQVQLYHRHNEAKYYLPNYET